LLLLTQARASARALLSVFPHGIAAGAGIGLALGVGFLVSGIGHDVAAHTKTARLAHAVSGDFSEQTLRVMAAEDPGALAIALRYNPSLIATHKPFDRRSLELAEQLDHRASKAGGVFLRASVSSPSNPAARPWQASALDQSRQLDCLAQAVYYEARGETPVGQAAVAQVVLNRVRHPAFPKSVCAVVYQGAQVGRGCQFSFACNGAMNRNREPSAWNRAEKVAARALAGYVMADVGNATHFHVTSVRPGWGPKLLRVSQIGTHVFYRFGGRVGAPGAFIAEPEAEPAKRAPILASLTIEPIDPAPVAAAANAVVGSFVRVEPASAVAAPATGETGAEAAKPAPTAS
jgi:spore germination cell wall hydrolase CwlJ-like protein